MSKRSRILLHGSETTTVFRHLEEIVLAGNTVVFSFQTQQIMALVTRLELNNARPNPGKSKPRTTTGRAKRVLLH